VTGGVRNECNLILRDEYSVGNFGLLYIYPLDGMGNDLLAIIIIIICKLISKCILNIIHTETGPP
jgi:uncharacterized membrane protein